MRFDPLAIQENVEEMRLVFGQKLNYFLLKKLSYVTDFLAKIFANKALIFLGPLFAILVSIFIQSTRDLGQDSAVYLEIAQKIIAGGSYYDDFFEPNFPLAFLMTIVPLKTASLFGLNSFLVSQIFWNLLGILSIFWSTKILQKSHLAQNQTILNLMILAFTIGFFWRVFTLQFNEFGTKSTYLLVALFPYFSYQISGKFDKKSTNFFCGSLAAFIISLKPHYAIYVLFFELRNFVKNPKISRLFCLRNFVTLTLLALYLLVLIKFFDRYLDNLSHLSSAYYQTSDGAIFEIMLFDIFPIVLLVCCCFKIFQKQNEISPFLVLAVAAMLVVLVEFIGGLDQRFIIFSLSLPVVFLAIYFIAKNHLINWSRDLLWLVPLLIVPQFDAANFFRIIFYVLNFWWIFALFIWLKWRAQYRFKPLLILIALAVSALTISLTLLGVFSEIVWFISALSFCVLVIFEQKLHQKFIDKNQLSRFSASVLMIIFSYFLSLHLAAIFNLKTNFDAYRISSPNQFNSQIIKSIKTYGNKGSTVMIANEIADFYPAISYSSKVNELPFLQYKILFKRIVNDEAKDDQNANYMIAKLKQKMASEKNKILIVQSGGYIDQSRCSIGFLEFYFRDEEFRKIFVENYRFLTRATNIVNISSDQQIIERDAEIYIRK